MEKPRTIRNVPKLQTLMVSRVEDLREQLFLLAISNIKNITRFPGVAAIDSHHGEQLFSEFPCLPEGSKDRKC